MQEDIDFLVHRAARAGHVRFSERFTGVSSNDLVRLAYTGMSDKALPRDHGDAHACARTWEMLPKHRRNADVRAQLERGFQAVARKYGTRAYMTEIDKAEGT